MLANSEQVEALVNLFLTGTRMTYRRDEYVVRPGETPSGVFYIEEGMIKALNISKYGEENLLIIRKSGEIFPLIWATTGDQKDIIFQSVTNSVLWKIDREAYLDFLKNQPESLMAVLDITTTMYRIHSERILNLEYRTVRERLVSFLLTMSNRFGTESEEGLLIDVPLRHQDIASSINASRETASRELAVLERKGWIANKRSQITLVDIGALKAVL